jgi:hypothetical protein
MELSLRAYVWARTAVAALARDEAGEGVISTAIAGVRLNYADIQPP